ncbi:MAG: dephospho-CoA kinase [Deltaproteobacteria bacterium]|nr:dephospho-CoA kinase [Deltaproteobacteria bacterium]
MKIFGLTGGIGCGKTTIARMLQSAGVEGIDADHLARLAIAKGSVGLEKIVARFGEHLLDEQGELVRKKLGDVVFSNEEARGDLNRIVHPEVARLFMEHVAALDDKGVAELVYEVPLLFENGLQDGFEKTLLVVVPQETQKSRVMNRDGLTSKEAQDRMDSQLPLSEKRKLADYVVDNSGSEAETWLALQKIWLEMTGARICKN